MIVAASERVLRKAEIGDCWTFRGALVNGYGYTHVVDAPGKYRTAFAHRVVYEELVGPVPTGKDLDHLCRNRACVNPDHLQPVSRRENLLRGQTIVARQVRRTHCPRGHEYTENTYLYRNMRYCRACREIVNNARKRAI
jgi:hypothetical protein